MDHFFIKLRNTYSIRRQRMSKTSFLEIVVVSDISTTMSTLIGSVQEMAVAEAHNLGRLSAIG